MVSGTASWRDRRRWPFAGLALAAALSVAAIVNFGVLAGRVPLPADLLGYFPAWEGAGIPVRPPTARFAEEGDLVTLMYPWRAFLAESLRSGRLPFWNPHVMMGSPFLANPISAVFYPPNWAFAVLPTPRAWSVQFPVRTGLAVFLAAMLARRIGASRQGAILAGIVFALSGFMTAWQGWPQADCMLWAPLIMLCFLGIRRRPTARRGALLGLAMSLPILAGHPEVALYAISLGFGFGGVMFVSGWRRTAGGRWARRFAGSTLLGLALAGGMCAVQLVPTAEWLTHITRTLDHPWGARAARDVVSLVSRDARSNPNSAGILVPEECCYPSIAVLLLAPLALLHRRRALAAYFALAAWASVGVAFGISPFSPIFHRVPILRGLPGNRMLGVFDLSIAILAGIGLTVLERRKPGQPIRGILVAIAAASIGLGLLGAKLHGAMWARAGTTSGNWTVSVALALASLALIVVALLRPRLRAPAAAVLALATTVDLVTFSLGHVPLVAVKAVFPWSPLFDFLRTETPADQRVLLLDRTAFANVEMIYGLAGPGGYPQVLKSTARLLAPLNGGSEVDEPLPPFDTSLVLRADPGLLDRLGLRFLVVNVYAESAERLAALATRFAPRYGGGTVRVFENRTAWPLVSLDRSAGGSAPHFRREGNSVSGQIDAERPGSLFVAQTYYPGWRAYLDGVEAPVRASADGLCEVPVQGGHHSFRLEFTPSRFFAAAAVSGSSLLSAVLLLVLPRPASRTPRRRP